MSEDRYLADHADFEDEGARLALIEKLYDPNSHRNLSKTGIGSGWKCLEVGAGGGSLTRWLSSQTKPSGLVVALDIDCRFLNDIDLPNVEVREGSILKDDIEDGCYDLVYARLMLQHLPESEAAVAKMVQATKPGGWLVIEDSDFSSMRGAADGHPGNEAFDKWIEDRCDYLREWNIMDLHIGRKLPDLFARLELKDIENEGTTWLRYGGDAAGKLWNMTFRHNESSFIENKVYTREAWEERLDILLDPTFRFTDFTMFVVWGRRPKR
ncbi:MAG: methyltransferase domain-containing protein [Alphaproteobacteria bacterium]|nr:methyltransferase domain-containing protein [Alphaproteobacteria bacterium]